MGAVEKFPCQRGQAVTTQAIIDAQPQEAVPAAAVWWSQRAKEGGVAPLFPPSAVDAEDLALQRVGVRPLF